MNKFVKGDSVRTLASSARNLLTSTWSLDPTRDWKTSAHFCLQLFNRTVSRECLYLPMCVQVSGSDTVLCSSASVSWGHLPNKHWDVHGDLPARTKIITFSSAPSLTLVVKAVNSTVILALQLHE